MNPFDRIQEAACSQEEYFQIDAYSSSDLRRLASDRLNPWGVYEQRRTPVQESEPMLFGSAVDCALLEPKLFNERYIFADEAHSVPTTDAQHAFVNAILEGKDHVEAHAEAYSRTGKKYADNLRDELSGYIALQKLTRDSDQKVLPYSFKDRLRKTVDALRSHRLVPDLLEKSRKQVVYTAEAFGVTWKGMLDMETMSAVTDLKTTGDWYGRRRNFFHRGYNIQLTLYKWLAGRENMVVLFAESDEPHRVSLTDVGAQFGEEEVRQWEEKTLDLMKRIAHADKTGDWKRTMEYHTNNGYEEI